ncbi:MAG: nucleoside deaminase [Zoogloeaceae bacterium]|jgi:tRNA(Arg) A34 adenosine deaminase TadA|nr:nucleoside deaminase [Zoogloeaceae bacterium]
MENPLAGAPSPDIDLHFLRRALNLAAENVERGDGGPFGAVIAQDGRVIAEARNLVLAENDPTAHAEIQAIRAACRKVGHFHLENCVLYASSEPCPMCLAAAYWARVTRIVYANSRLQAASAGFDDADLYRELCLPAAARRILVAQRTLAEANAPFAAWHNSAKRQMY